MFSLAKKELQSIIVKHGIISGLNEDETDVRE